jgi:archaeosortase A (PGF-CTERM-specific)
MSDALAIAGILLLLISIILLALGFFRKDNKCHLFRMAGLLIFGIYWVTQVPHFLEMNDYANAVIAEFGLVFYIYLSFQEYLSYKWEEDNASLKFMVGTSLFAVLPFMLFSHIPMVSAAIIYVVAANTVSLLNLFGHNYELGELLYIGSKWFSYHGDSVTVQIKPSIIYIIFSCTAFQSIMIFVGAILASASEMAGKKKALLLIVPIIYVLNIIRTAGIVYLVDFKGYTAEYAHNVIGKSGSLIALVFLAFVLFKFMPKLEDEVLGLFDLVHRKKQCTDDSVKNEMSSDLTPTDPPQR